MCQSQADRPKKHVENAAATYHRLQETIEAAQRRSAPDGAMPRPADLGEAGRPHLAVSGVPLGVEAKHNRLTGLQLTPPAEPNSEHYK